VPVGDAPGYVAGRIAAVEAALAADKRGTEIVRMADASGPAALGSAGCGVAPPACGEAWADVENAQDDEQDVEEQAEAAALGFWAGRPQARLRRLDEDGCMGGESRTDVDDSDEHEARASGPDVPAATLASSGSARPGGREAWAGIQEMEERALGGQDPAPCRLQCASRGREPLPRPPDPTEQLQEKVDTWHRLRWERRWADVRAMEEHLHELGVSVDPTSLTWEGPGGGGHIAGGWMGVGARVAGYLGGKRPRGLLEVTFAEDDDGEHDHGPLCDADSETSGSSGAQWHPVRRPRRRRKPPPRGAGKGGDMGQRHA
jgi:hypothetical protein